MLPRTSHATSAETPPCTIQDLPQEVLLHIFSHLSAPDAFRTGIVCREWQILLNDNRLWESFFRRDFKSRYASSKVENTQQNYKKRYLMHANPVNRNVFEKDVLKGHIDKVISLVYADGMLFSGSRDRTIRVWNIHKRNCQFVLRGHKAWVTSLVYADKLLYSSSNDQTIKIWNLQKGNACLRTLVGHTGGVTSLVDAGGLLCSGSNDETIKIWNKDTGVCLRTLQGHTNSVTSLGYADHGILISGSTDASIRFWDINSGNCLNIWKISNGAFSTIRSLAYCDRMLSVGVEDGVIEVWNIDTGNRLHTFDEGHRGQVSSLAYADGLLFSGSSYLGDHAIKIWDTDTGECLRTLYAEAWSVNSIAYGRGMLFSSGAECSGDGTIEIWDFGFPRLSSYGKSVCRWTSCVIY